MYEFDAIWIHLERIFDVYISLGISLTSLNMISRFYHSYTVDEIKEEIATLQLYHSDVTRTGEDVFDHIKALDDIDDLFITPDKEGKDDLDINVYLLDPNAIFDLAVRTIGQIENASQDDDINVQLGLVEALGGTPYPGQTPNVNNAQPDGTAHIKYLVDDYLKDSAAQSNALTQINIKLCDLLYPKNNIVAQTSLTEQWYAVNQIVTSLMGKYYLSLNTLNNLQTVQ